VDCYHLAYFPVRSPKKIDFSIPQLVLSLFPYSRNMKSFIHATVIENRSAPTYSMLRVASNEGLLHFSPGQYFAIAAKKGSIQTPMRCFSAVSIAGSNELELVFRRVGNSTKSLSKLNKGDEVTLLGPFGEFTLDYSTEPVVLISSGIGVTPFISMLRNELARPSGRQITVLISARSLSELPYIQSLRSAIVGRKNIRLELFSGQPEQGATQGRIDAKVIDELVSSQPNSSRYYICGPDEFVIETERSLESVGVNKRAIHSESFAQAERSIAGKSMVQTVIWSTLSVSGILFLLFVFANAIGDSQATTSTITSNTESTEASESVDDTESDDSSTTDTGSSTTTPSQSYSQPSSYTYSQPSSTAS